MLHRPPPTDAPMTLKRLERAMDVLCRVMEQAADEHAIRLVPLFELLEREIEVRRSAEAALTAARSRRRR